MLTPYQVVLNEKHAEGWTLRRMLVAKFVSKGDAISYVIYRQHAGHIPKGCTLDVETSRMRRGEPTVIHSLYTAQLQEA